MTDILTEIRAETSLIWKDTQAVKWRDTAGVEWFSTTTTRISTEAVADTHYWDDHVISFTPPQYVTSWPWGGYSKLTFGDMEFDLDFFTTPTSVGNAIFSDTAGVAWGATDGVTWQDAQLVGLKSDLWPIPRELKIRQQFTETDEASLVLVYDGTGYLADYDRESARYDLYPETYTQDLLAEAVDYNDETVVLPRAFGAVTHVEPVRLPDVGGYPTYHLGYILGLPGTDWHAFDDGVNIDSNVTINGDGTFSLSATPVGVVTISGTGEDSTLTEIISWACMAGRLGLSYTFDSAIAESPSPTVKYWAYSQEKLIDFLERLAAFFNHLFYINASVLTLVAMTKNNGTRTLSEYDYFAAPRYSYDPPTSILKATWQTRAAVEETIGKYVKSTDQEAEVTSEYPYGDPQDIEPFTDDRAEIRTRLSAILTSIHKPRIAFQIPISDNLPVPGEQIILTDTSFKADITMTMNCRSIRYDFKNDTVEIEGEGAIS